MLCHKPYNFFFQIRIQDNIYSLKGVNKTDKTKQQNEATYLPSQNQ